MSKPIEMQFKASRVNYSANGRVVSLAFVGHLSDHYYEVFLHENARMRIVRNGYQMSSVPVEVASIIAPSGVFRSAAVL